MNTSSLLFNATVSSSSISAAFELGLFDRISEAPEGISLDHFCNEKGIDLSSFLSIVCSLQFFDIIRNENGVLRKGEAFEEIQRNQGYFHWMIKGYADFLGDFCKLLNRDSRKGKFYRRDGAAIALSGKDYGEKFVDSYVKELVCTLPITKIADLGCGSANRLLQIAKWTNCSAVGVEIDEGGVAVARENVKRSGLSNIQIIQSDVAKLPFHEEFREVDLISSFFMGHDLWPRARCIQIFQNLRRVFPSARYFLFCDTFQSNLPSQKAPPIFTLGFEVFHALMDQYIPTAGEWRDLFAEGGWSCVKEIPTEIPYTNIFLLRPLEDIKATP